MIQTNLLFGPRILSWLRLLAVLASIVLILYPGRAQVVSTSAPSVTANILSPGSITDIAGKHEGSTAALAVKDQTGNNNNPARYVAFNFNSANSYHGYHSYFLPATVDASKITTITLIANILGPSSSSNAWTWSIYNWMTSQYENLGNQNNCGGTSAPFTCAADQHGFTAWKWLQYNALGKGHNYVNATTHEVRIGLASDNNTDPVYIDYESVSVYSNSGIPKPLWKPQTNVRWQWQIQASAKDGASFPKTNGINVNICQPPFQGGACVKPDVFDIDLYVDSNLTGTYDNNTVADDFRFTTDAVNAIHASGRKVIGYITVGDAENWRADFQQMVDFDKACGGCFIGNPFSTVFPDEFYVNINNDKGQADFMRKMVQARIDKVAAAGFDSVEDDVVFAYENDSGFDISYDTQIAYNESIAKIAHGDGLSLPLKSDVDQAMDTRMITAFDYVIDEQCFQYDQCGNYAGFQKAGKAIFNAEYTVASKNFCLRANAMNFNSIKKADDFSLLDLPWTSCR